MIDLSDKHILITGASSGIGRSTAILCSQLGARLTITGRNNIRLNETLSLLEGENHNSVVSDLSISSNLKDLAEILPSLDGIVHCAGIHENCTTRFLNLEMMESLMNINYFSIVQLISYILQKKKLRKGASVVLISSVAAFRYAEIGNALYSSTKAALSSYSRVLALELSKRSIRVNTVSPGMVKTPMQKSFDVTPEQFEKDKQNYPLGYGEPEYIANAIVFLLSDMAKWITGSDLVIDGGLSLK